MDLYVGVDYLQKVVEVGALGTDARLTQRSAVEDGMLVEPGLPCKGTEDVGAETLVSTNSSFQE